MAKGEIIVGPDGKTYRDNGDGTATPVVRGGINAIPPDAPFKGPQAEAGLNQTLAQTQATQAGVANDAQRIQLDRQKFIAEQAAKGLELDGSGNWRPIEGWQPPVPARPNLEGGQFKDAMGAYFSALELERSIRDIEAAYKEGPGSTGKALGFQDYLPIESMQRFDKASSAARGPAIAALGFAASQMNTPAEAQLNIGAYIPSSGQYDRTIEDTISRLKELQQSVLKRSVAVLGGIPDTNGNITPAEQVSPEKLPAGIDVDYSRARLAGAKKSTMEAAGAFDSSTSEAVPPEYQAAYEEWYQQNGGQNFNPESYAQKRMELDRAFINPGAPFDPAQYQRYLENGAAIKSGLEKGGTIDLRIRAPERDLSMGEKGGNALANAFSASGLAGATSLVSRAMAPEQYDALAAQNPKMTLLGEIGGSIAGVEGLSKAGAGLLAKYAPRIAPKLLGGGRMAQVGRNLAADTTYGTVYGTAQGQDPLTSAAAAGVGSLVGQGIGGAGGKMLSGLAETPAAQRLAALDIPLTVGQRLGGIPARIEDRMTSIPGVGDMIRNRHIEGRMGGLAEAGRQAGEPIGYAPRLSGGREIADELKRAGTDAYEASTAGVAGPLDESFTSDIDALGTVRESLLPDQQVVFDKFLANRVTPLLRKGELTGVDFQQIMKGVKKGRTKPPGIGGFESTYRDAMTNIETALTGQMGRISPEAVVGLNKANSANRSIEALKSAIKAAKANNYTPTPFQLQQAGWKTADKYPGPRPFGQLADDMQETMGSKIADSGTASRAAQLMLPGALAGGASIGAGAGYATGGDPASGAGVGLTGAAIMAALSTRSGQKALGKILFDRPDILKNRKLAKRATGLFGTASVVPALRSEKK